MDLAEASNIVAQGWGKDAPLWEEHWTPIFQTFALNLVRRARLGPGMAVLDVGCGTGLATFLAGRAVGPGGSVMGVDRARGMLRVAQGKARAAGVQNVSFRYMDATRLRLPRGGFRRAISNCGIGNAAVPEAMEQIHRVLSPGGRFALANWFAPSGNSPGGRLFGPLEDLLLEYRSPNPGPRLARVREAREVVVGSGKAHGNRMGVLRAMKTVGFEDVTSETRLHTLELPSVDHFLEACLRTDYRRSELRAMGARREAEFRERARGAYLRYGGRGPMRLPWPMTYFAALKP